MNYPKLQLRDGNQMPLLAWGCYTGSHQPEGRNELDSEIVEITKAALDLGFRHLDCTELHGREAEVGVALKESGIPRNEVFITSKVPFGFQDIDEAINSTLKNLQLDYVDLYLSTEWVIREPSIPMPEDADIQAAWKAMEKLKSEGKARSIGVTHLGREQVEEILNGETSDPPVINQLDLTPTAQRDIERVPGIHWITDYNIERTLRRGLEAMAARDDDVAAKPLKRIAEAHNSSEKVVMRRWLVQQQVVVVSTADAAEVEQLKDYRQTLDIELTKDEVKELSEIAKAFLWRWDLLQRNEEGAHS